MLYLYPSAQWQVMITHTSSSLTRDPPIANIYFEAHFLSFFLPDQGLIVALPFLSPQKAIESCMM